MSFGLAFSIKVFSARFAIMRPVVKVPVYLSLTDGATDAERRKMAATALVALPMLRGSESTRCASTEQERKDAAALDSLAICPLALPLLLRLVAFVLLAVFMRSTPFIGLPLWPKMTAITQRLMRMTLAAIAVDMMLTSLRASFRGLT